MRLDKFNNPIFNEVDVFNAMYAGHTSTLPLLTVDPSEDIESLANHAEIKFNTYERILETVSVSDYDSVIQHNWFMPAEYYTIDIEAYCLSKCSTTQQRMRISDEMIEFSNRGLQTLLQWLKYFVDTCTAEGVLWGVGRGSSTASYVLYVIGVHRIDSLKYELDYKEFLR